MNTEDDEPLVGFPFKGMGTGCSCLGGKGAVDPCSGPYAIPVLSYKSMTRSSML